MSLEFEPRLTRDWADPSVIGIDGYAATRGSGWRSSGSLSALVMRAVAIGSRLFSSGRDVRGNRARSR